MTRTQSTFIALSACLRPEFPTVLQDPTFWLLRLILNNLRGIFRETSLAGNFVWIRLLVMGMAMHLNQGTAPTPVCTATIVQDTLSAMLSRDVVLLSKVIASKCQGNDDVNVERIPNGNATRCHGGQDHGKTPRNKEDACHNEACALIVVSTGRHSQEIVLHALEDLPSHDSGTAPSHQEWTRTNLATVTEIMFPASLNAA